MPPLFLALAPAQSLLLAKVRDLCRPDITNDILALISETINEDVIFVDKPLDLRNQRTYAVKVCWCPPLILKVWRLALTTPRPVCMGSLMWRERPTRRPQMTCINTSKN